jgi:hypothetical protein
MEKFYLVVPSTSYREFKKQKDMGGTASREKEAIEQYVLSIPLEPNFALWLSGIDPERNPKVLAQGGERMNEKRRRGGQDEVKILLDRIKQIM